MVRHVFPLTTFLRKAVYFTVFGMFLASLILGPDFFELSDLSRRVMLTLILLIMAIPALLKFFDSLIEKIADLFKRLKNWRENRKKNKLAKRAIKAAKKNGNKL
jgi:hypothetical protein